MNTPSPGLDIPQGTSFGTTHWSLVLSAGKFESPKAAQALDTLCRTYWYPLYAFVRRQGHNPQDAEDLTQDFICLLLERKDFAVASPERGRFRCFLLGAMKHFLANDWCARRAQKRGGGRAMLSLNTEGAEERYRLEPADCATPAVLFERRWATSVLDLVIDRLRAEFAAGGRADLFEALKAFLSEKQPEAHEEIAGRLKIPVTTVGVAIHRLRKRYGELVRDEIRQTVSRPEEVADEVRHLIAVVGR